MLQLKEILRRTATKQNVCFLLSLMVILISAAGLTTIVAYHSSRQSVVDEDVQPTASGYSPARLDVIFRAVFTFVAVFSIGVTVSICLWVMSMRRATSSGSSSGQDNTGDDEVCIMENRFVHYCQNSSSDSSSNNNNNKAEEKRYRTLNSDSADSLLHPDFRQSDQ